jgi:predicted Holliday junction resolvase-like endonuclease
VYSSASPISPVVPFVLVNVAVSTIVEFSTPIEVLQARINSAKAEKNATQEAVLTRRLAQTKEACEEKANLEQKADATKARIDATRADGKAKLGRKSKT